MPKMDGIEATQHIRNFEKKHDRKRSCICAVTATAVKELEDKCMEVGMEFFMTKPFQMKSLQLLLSRVERKLKKGSKITEKEETKKGKEIDLSSQ